MTTTFVIPAEVLEKGMPSEESGVSPEKARKILKDGTVNGQPLSDKQRRMFGAIAGKMKKSEIGVGEDLQKSLLYGSGDWANQFMGYQDLYVKALELLKDQMNLNAEREKFQGSGKSWEEIEEMPRSRRDEYRKKRNKERSKFDKRSGDLQSRKCKLEEELLDKKIADAKMRKSMDGVEALGDYLSKAGPFIGPKGGKWADAKHTIPWKERKNPQQSLPLKFRGEGGTDITAKRKEAAKFIDKAPGGSKVTITFRGGRESTYTRSADGMWETPSTFNNKSTRKVSTDQLEDLITRTDRANTMAHDLKWTAGKGGADASQESDSKQKGIKKSEDPMSSFNALEDFLRKSGGLPTHEPKMGAPKSQEIAGGSQDGGEVEAVGTTSGSGDSASGPGQDSQGQVKTSMSGSEKLSADDADEEKQMKSHTKPIESMGKSLTPANQRDMVAHEQAQVESHLRKGDEDVFLHPYSMQKSHGTTDEDAADLLKSEFYHGPSPEKSSPRPLIDQGVLCKSVHMGGCETNYSAALTACPGCGAGGTVNRLVPPSGSIGMVLEKSQEAPLLRRPPQEEDVYFG